MVIDGHPERLTCDEVRKEKKNVQIENEKINIECLREYLKGELK